MKIIVSCLIAACAGAAVIGLGMVKVPALAMMIGLGGVASTLAGAWGFETILRHAPARVAVGSCALIMVAIMIAVPSILMAMANMLSESMPDRLAFYAFALLMADAAATGLIVPDWLWDGGDQS